MKYKNIVYELSHVLPNDSSDYIFMTSIRKMGEGLLKFVTQLWVLLFLKIDSFFFFADGGL